MPMGMEYDFWEEKQSDFHKGFLSSAFSYVLGDLTYTKQTEGY